jgi:predicted adenylyl cyclase CyaB
MRNVELKARLDDLESARLVARRLAGGPAATQHQVDTYFCCRNGRLKLREIDEQAAQLVWYDRADAQGPKPSDYQLVPVAEPGPLKAALTAALGTAAVVDKRREIYLYENVRIHLDRVDGLGDFLEFEAVLSAGADESAQRKKLRWMAEEFSISPAALICGSYGDLVHGPRQ